MNRGQISNQSVCLQLFAKSGINFLIQLCCKKRKKYFSCICNLISHYFTINRIFVRAAELLSLLLNIWIWHLCYCSGYKKQIISATLQGQKTHILHASPWPWEKQSAVLISCTLKSLTNVWHDRQGLMVKPLCQLLSLHSCKLILITGLRENIKNNNNIKIYEQRQYLLVWKSVWPKKCGRKVCSWLGY